MPLCIIVGSISFPFSKVVCPENKNIHLYSLNLHLWCKVRAMKLRKDTSLDRRTVELRSVEPFRCGSIIIEINTKYIIEINTKIYKEHLNVL